MSISIRLLSDGDLETADAILKSAFRGSESRIRDLHFYRSIQPDGWFLALREGLPVGMVGTTNYGTFAYVGLMAVHPDAQRRGIGLALMQHLLSWIDKQKVPLVLLDASEAGEPLYKKLGFISYDRTYVFQRTVMPTGCKANADLRPLSTGELDEVLKWDAEVIGGDRRKVLLALLAHFPGRAFMMLDEHGHVTGYIFAQRSRIGPWLAQNPRDAERLFQTALSLPYESTVSVVVPQVNAPAIELLKRYGFERARTNRRMARGSTAPRDQRTKIYAQTSLALG